MFIFRFSEQISEPKSFYFLRFGRQKLFFPRITIHTPSKINRDKFGYNTISLVNHFREDWLKFRELKLFIFELTILFSKYEYFLD